MTRIKYLKPTPTMTREELVDEVENLRVAIVELQKRVEKLENKDLAARLFELDGKRLPVLHTYERLDNV